MRLPALLTPAGCASADGGDEEVESLLQRVAEGVLPEDRREALQLLQDAITDDAKVGVRRCALVWAATKGTSMTIDIPPSPTDQGPCSDCRCWFLRPCRLPLSHPAWVPLQTYKYQTQL